MGWCGGLVNHDCPAGRANDQHSPTHTPSAGAADTPPAGRLGVRSAARHVLAIQNTTVIKSEGGGGLYLHMRLALDADDGAILGLADATFHGGARSETGWGARDADRERGSPKTELYRLAQTQRARTRNRAGLMGVRLPLEGRGAPFWRCLSVGNDRLAAPPARILRSRLPLLARI